MDTTNEGVTQYANQYSCDILIHGHTHRPKIHAPLIINGKKEQRSVQRITLGDWGEQAIGLELNEENLNYTLVDYI